MDTTKAIAEIRGDVKDIKRALVDVRHATQPRMHWIPAVAGALLAIAVGSVAIPAYLPEDARTQAATAIDWTANQIAIAGQVLGDYVGNVDRSYSAPIGGLQLIGLDDVQSCRWRYAVRMAESSGHYDHPGNKYGYFAGYGMGAEALSIVGLVKRSAFASAPRAVRSGNDQTAWLDNPANWTLAGGKSAFLASPHLQDVAVTGLANTNIQDGFDGHILSRSKPEQIAGFAAAAHLKGLTAAISWYLRGKDSADANGTPTSKYAGLGEGAISQAVAECGDGGGAIRPNFWARFARFVTPTSND